MTDPTHTHTDSCACLSVAVGTGTCVGADFVLGWLETREFLFLGTDTKSIHQGSETVVFPLLTCMPGQWATICSRRAPVPTSLTQRCLHSSAWFSDPSLTLGYYGSRKSSAVLVDFPQPCKICLQRTLSSSWSGERFVPEPLNFAWESYAKCKL